MPKSSLPWWRQLLRPLGWLYGIGVMLHRFWHRSGPGGCYKARPALLVVGNLSVGGTGKTPHVAYLYQLLAPTPLALVSRGYGRQSRGVQLVEAQSTAEQVGDEPLMLYRQWPQALVVVAERRAEGIEQVLALRPTVEAILLDDALQHWAIQPDVAILLTTFSAPFFDDVILPVGRLREFKQGYQRAHIIIVTKCPPHLSPAQRQAYRQAIRPLPQQLVVFSHYTYQRPYALMAPTARPDWSHWAKTAVLLVTGLAQPQDLEAFVQQHTQAAQFQHYPDHHAYTAQELRQVTQQAAGRPVWITEKDAVKWRPFQPLLQQLKLAVYVLPIQVALSPADEAQLDTHLRQAIAHKKNAHRP